MDNKPDLDKAIRNFAGARAFLGIIYPFYMGLISELSIRFTFDQSVPTAGVTQDGRLFINADFFNGLESVQQRAFLLSHEVLHPALGFWFRSTGMDHEYANIAHDHAINLILIEEENASANNGRPMKWTIPDLYADKKYTGWAFEEIYADITKGRNKANRGRSAEVIPCGSDALDNAEGDAIQGYDAVNGQETLGPGPDRDCSDHTLKNIWDSRIYKAFHASRQMGKDCAGMNRLVAYAGESSVPWTELLRLAINDSTLRSRNDWSYPSRRSSALGIYCPREENLGFEVMVYVDSSGSISDDNLKVACRETASIILNAGGSIRWMEGDADVLKDEWITDPPETIKGGGGTSFVPVFDRLVSDPPKLLVIFTDTYGTMPDFIPDFPVIWGVFTQPGKETPVDVPFGEVIRIPAQ